MSKFVTHKDRLAMPYTDAVLLEVLRKANIASTALTHTLEKEIVVDGKVSYCLVLFRNPIYGRLLGKRYPRNFKLEQTKLIDKVLAQGTMKLALSSPALIRFRSSEPKLYN